MLKISTCFAALLVSIASGGSHAQDTDGPAPDLTLLDYADTSGAALLLDGRRIQIVCMGQGSPTVILTAGLSQWGTAWAPVHRSISQQTRVCSWDRPGLGFSDSSTITQTSDATTDDLEAALRARNIDGPYVLVGHSMGAYETLTFTDRHRGQVVGIVLVDPSIPNQTEVFDAAAPAYNRAQLGWFESQLALLRRCIAGIRSGDIHFGGPDPDECLVYPSEFPKELADELGRLDSNPERANTLLSQAENFDLSSGRVSSASRDYGDLPLIVLTQGKPFTTGLPEDALAEYPQWNAAWVGAHDALAALSTRGVNRVIPDAGHVIQKDRPDVVIEAVREVVEAARSDASRP